LVAPRRGVFHIPSTTGPRVDDLSCYYGCSTLLDQFVLDWKSRVRMHTRIGLKLGAAMAALSVLLIFTGRAGIGIPAPLLPVLYLLGGVMVSVVIGLLEPLARGLIGKVMVGICAALPFSLLLALTFLSQGRDLTAALAATGLGALWWGTIGGVIAWVIRDNR